MRRITSLVRTTRCDVYITKVEVANIRGFHGAKTVDIEFGRRADRGYAGWTVIAGRNGSGKTSLLRALALAVTGPSVARNLVPDFENWISVGQREAQVRVHLDYDPAVDKFSGAGKPPKSPVAASLIWTRPEPGSSGRQPSLVEASRTARRGPWQDNPTGWFCAAYGPFRRLVGGSGEAQRLMMSPGPARMASLFHEDASLAEGVSWLIDQHLRALEKRPGAVELKDSAMAVLGDGLLPNGYQIRHVDSDGLWVESDGHKFPLREMSDGYRTVAALTVDLIKQIHQSFGRLPFALVDGRPVVMAPGVVVIDEADAHLHVSWQQRIGTWLKTHFPAIQFIVTTHSPYICQAADVGGLIRLPGPDERVAPKVVDHDLYERVVFGSGDYAVLSELFGLDTPYSAEARRLRSELGSLELRVIAGDATEEQVERYRELDDKLTSSPASSARDLSRRLAGRGR